MRTKEFSFNLPKELIADNPVVPRDNSRLMVLRRNTKQIEHRIFKDLPDIIDDNYVVVLNKTRVFPAKFKIIINERHCEILLIKQIIGNKWQCMVKPGRYFKIGKELIVKGKIDTVKAVIDSINIDGTRNIKFEINDDIFNWAEHNGYPPFPPYIKNSSATSYDYQTLYAHDNGSIAAPTAGLHFTDNVFKTLEKKGIQKHFVTLHIGRGTFLPVKSEHLEDHKMHKEWYEITKETADALNEAKKKGKKILAVGTTSVRTLESNFLNNFSPETNDTDIFIYPGYKFKAVDALLTNFHLPESTLIMLVSAFAGKNFIFDAYMEAIRLKYRFYSFGDAMLIL
ncbi:tRNA preQ1(34) S-adenosylmethionine ribosyltransferase-isomerase QueA [Candidatus Peregrinibacteria bacterium]|nr:tRNA preQ1(34) S-adenosylmethionine ribosyltransferase-isomerase QueA [Candidatus Peregrinibacteria bacterium]